MPSIIPVSAWGGTVGALISVAPSARTEFFVHFDGNVPIPSTRKGYDIPLAIQRTHLGNGWEGPGGYNFVIESNVESPTDGVIYEMRGWNHKGAHCPNHNASGIGVQIAIGGDQKISVKALQSLIWLYGEANRRTDKTLTIKGHRDGIATICPGEGLYKIVKNGLNFTATVNAGLTVGQASLEDVDPLFETPEQFIARIKNAAQLVQQRYLVPASVCIAQAALETGWGKSSLAKVYNFFGIKADAVKSKYQSGSVSKSTLEYFDGVTPTTVVDAFRAYRTAEDGFSDYGDFIYSSSRYWGAFRYILDPKMFARKLAEYGYATDPAYGDKIANIIDRYNLTQYDQIKITPVVVIPETPAVPEPETPPIVEQPVVPGTETPVVEEQPKVEEPVVVQPPADDGTDRHIPATYPYVTQFTLDALKRAASVEVLTGDDYNQRLQALISLKALGFNDHYIPNQGEPWVQLFTWTWTQWQKSLGYTGAAADGVPGEVSAKALAQQVGLGFVEPAPADDGQDRTWPSGYPYTDTLTKSRLERAATTDVLNGEDFNHRIQAIMSIREVLGWKGDETPGMPPQGRPWSEHFKSWWKSWQEALGYVGSAADGIPGDTSIKALCARVQIKYFDGVNPATIPGPVVTPFFPEGYPAPVSSKMVNPTDGGYITTPFAKLPNNNTYWQTFGKHTGVDFARSVCKSDALYAVDSGVITYRWSNVLGHMLILEADSLKGQSRRFFWYCHLKTKPTISGRVTKGQRIATMGQSGSGASGPHLHLELSSGAPGYWPTAFSQFDDPAKYIAQR